MRVTRGARGAPRDQPENPDEERRSDGDGGCAEKLAAGRSLTIAHALSPAFLDEVLTVTHEWLTVDLDRATLPQVTNEIPVDG